MKKETADRIAVKFNFADEIYNAINESHKAGFEVEMILVNTNDFHHNFSFEDFQLTTDNRFLFKGYLIVRSIDIEAGTVKAIKK